MILSHDFENTFRKIGPNGNIPLVQTKAILFLQSMSEGVGSDIERD